MYINVHKPSPGSMYDGLNKSYVSVVPSSSIKNLLSPLGHGHLTLPNTLYKIVWTWPLNPHNLVGTYLKK